MNKILPEFCGNVVNLLLVLQHLLSISFKQQSGHTQVMGIKAFKLLNEVINMGLTASGAH